MNDDLSRAVREADEARERLSSNISDLAASFSGAAPILQTVSWLYRSRRSAAEQRSYFSEQVPEDDYDAPASGVGDLFSVMRKNPLPSLVMAVGAGWLLQRYLRPQQTGRPCSMRGNRRR